MILFILSVYGISYFLSTHFDDTKDNIVTYSTIHPLLYSFLSKVLYCQQCQSFWIGWIYQIVIFGTIFPYYAFGSYGFTVIINSFLTSQNSEYNNLHEIDDTP